MRKEFRTKLKGDDSRADASAYFTLPFDTRDVWGRVKMCTYKCIDTRQRRSYPVLVATSLCGLNGMNRKTDKTFASTMLDRKSTRLNSSHSQISYAVFCLKKKQIL